MKKLLSLALCCVIAASSLASCAQSAAKNYSPKIPVSSSEAEESALYLTNRPQADSEKTKTFKRKIHPLRGWIFIMRQAFSAAYPPSRHGAPTGFYKAASSINPAVFLSAVTVPSIRFFHRYRGTALNSASRDRNIGGLAVFILYFKACSVSDKRKRIPFALAVRSRGVQPITPSRTRAVGNRDRRFAAIYAVLRAAECKDNAAEIFRLRYSHGAITPVHAEPVSILRGKYHDRPFGKQSLVPRRALSFV